MDNYNDECIQDYTCPICKEAKLQSDKNARKINEIIEQVNAIIDLILSEDISEEKVEEINNLL